MFILSESISVQNLSSLTLKTKELWKGGGKHPPPPQWYNETKKPSAYRVKVRKALAWDSCHKLNRVWSSPLKRNIKVRLFLATVESVLLYGSNTWTLTKKLEQQLDGTYTRMLREALNISWRQHMTNEELYKNLQNVSKKIAERRLRLAGHCLRHPEEIASHLVLWQPTFGSTSRGRKATTFVNTLKRDTYLDSIQEIKTAAIDRRTLGHETFILNSNFLKNQLCKIIHQKFLVTRKQTY